MKKRLICLLLCLAMLLSLVLTACSSKDTEEAAENISDEASEAAKTLTMWIVSENELSNDTIKLVSDELNAITKSKFKTQLVLKFLTKDVYESTLSGEISNYEKAKENSGEIVTEATTDAAVTDATETLANGMTIIKYPETVPYQVDIIYIAGEDMFLDYVDKGWLAALDAELSGSSKKIKEYVSDTLLSAAKLNGTTYAVPNNNVIGEYTYMLLDKELMEKYSQQGYVTQGKLNGFFNSYLFNYLKLIDLFEEDVVPINATYEECLALLAHYWSVDPHNFSMLKDFSVFGYHYTDIASLSRGSVALGYNSLFEDEAFVSDYLKLNEMKYDGYFSEDTSKKAAVKFVKGDSTILKQYEDEYYSVIVEYPTAATDDIYSNMFGVCTYTRDLGRSMQIVTYLNTNATFRNILQYGVENKHYKTVTDEDTGKTSLVRLNEDYMMDLYATGNAFLAFPEPEMSEDIWDMGKVQNRGSLVNPLLGFNIPSFAVSSMPAAESAKLSDAGYNISYTSGYSKYVLSQNENLANWLENCDNTGKGIYLFKTYEISGQYITANYYIYNNDLSDNVGFTVTADPHTITQTDDSGKEKQVLESVDFIMEYQPTTGASEGYELSVFSLYTKKNTPYSFICKVDGEEKNFTESEYAKLINFDFLNTEQYSIDLYANITKTNVLKNKELMAWLEACDTAAGKNTSTFVKTYVDEATGDHTFIVYHTGMKYITESEFQPTGGEGKLNLAFKFSGEEGREYSLDSADRKYILYYVRVRPNDGVELDISYSITKNGKKLTSTVEEATEDPDFVMCGNLDTELIKYMYQLNKDLNAVINACATYEELEAVVAEIQLLLTTDVRVDYKKDDFVLLKDCIENGVIADDLTTLREYVTYATSSTAIKKMDGESEALWIDPIFENGETYVYYDSLYALYYKWMEAYGFKPAEKKDESSN